MLIIRPTMDSDFEQGGLIKTLGQDEIEWRYVLLAPADDKDIDILKAKRAFECFLDDYEPDYFIFWGYELQKMGLIMPDRFFMRTKHLIGLG